MTRLKKKKGFRTINVERQEFRWNFRPSFDNSYLTLQSTVTLQRETLVTHS